MITPETVVKDWDSKIRATIISKGINFDDVEDVKSTIYLNMLRSNLCGKYNPQRSKFSTYIYRYIHSQIKNYYRDADRDKRGVNKRSLSFEGYYSSDTECAMRTQTLINRASMDSHTTYAIDEFFIEASLFKELKTVGAVKLMKSEQNLKKAIKMILSGYGICYTWQFIGVSQKSFSSLLEMIKSIPWVRSLRNVK